MAGPLPPTPAARERLTALLEDLERVERPALAAAAAATQTGDAADLAATLDAQVKLARLDERMRTLREQLNAPRPQRTANGTVQVGSTVSVDWGEGPETLIVGSAGDLTADTDVITPDSPLGRAVLGATAGAQLTYIGPSGRETAVTIVAVV